MFVQNSFAVFFCIFLNWFDFYYTLLADSAVKNKHLK